MMICKFHEIIIFEADLDAIEFESLSMQNVIEYSIRSPLQPSQWNPSIEFLPMYKIENTQQAITTSDRKLSLLSDKTIDNEWIGSTYNKNLSANTIAAQCIYIKIKSS